MRTEYDLPGGAWAGGAGVVGKDVREMGEHHEERGAEKASLDTWEIYGL